MTRRIDFSPEALKDIEEIKDYLKAEFGEKTSTDCCKSGIRCRYAIQKDSFSF